MNCHLHECGHNFHHLFLICKRNRQYNLYSNISGGASETGLSDLMSELAILKEMNKFPHPNVLKLIGECVIEGEQTVLIVNHRNKAYSFLHSILENTCYGPVTQTKPFSKSCVEKLYDLRQSNERQFCLLYPDVQVLSRSLKLYIS